MPTDDHAAPGDHAPPDPDASPAERNTLSEDYRIHVPPAVRERLDLEPGDEIRWTLTEDGDVAIQKLDEDGEWGAFEGAETYDLGVDTLEAHDLAGAAPEHWP